MYSLGGEMGVATLKAVCGTVAVAIVLVFGISADRSALAGSRLYDMSAMLSAPHPYQQTQPSAQAMAVQPAYKAQPAGQAGGASFQTQAPLPGSRYGVSKRVRSATVPVGRPVHQTASSAAARAAGRAEPTRPSFVSEVVLGGWIHEPGQDNNEANTWDLNLEIVFRKVTFISFENRHLRFLFSPHPIIGGSINNEDETHTAYIALSWQHQFQSRWFIAGSFGFAYHTGNLHPSERACVLGDSCTLPGNRTRFDDGEVALGSRILFRESIEFGYRFAGRHGVSAYLAHMSNASLFDDDNDGMNFAGLRYRYAFD
tara:strand:- start:2309 stop:3250 length:942 start_codon:yes stop_codon:yes gene_type:complete